MQDHPKHYCGLFGIYGHPNAAELTYYGLFALQHRGQESAGIVACDGGQFRVHRGMGLVPQVFDGDVLRSLTGPVAVGHTRYSTMGSPNEQNAQPVFANSRYGPVALAHNGNIINARQLRSQLIQDGIQPASTSDTELILLTIIHRVPGSDWPERIAQFITSLKELFLSRY